MLSPAFLAPLLAALTAFAVALCPVWDYDIWFQLASGRAIMALRALPITDIFSFTAVTHPWDTQEWLSQIIFFLIEDRGGMAILTAVKALGTAVLFFIIARHAIRRSANPWITLILCAWGAFLMRWFTVERPAMFSMVFLAIQLSALSKGRAPWWLIPLSALWANLHGGSALLGPGVTGLWLATTGAVALWKREPLPGFKWSVLVLVSQTLVLLINPAGWHLLLYPFQTTSDLMYMENVKEWLPPTSGEFPGFFGLLVAVFLIFSFSMLTWSITDFLLMLVFGWLALSARRHIPLFVIAVLPALAMGATRILAGQLEKPRIKALLPASALVFSLLLVGALSWNGSALRWSIRHALYPAGGISFLKSNFPAMTGDEPIRLYTLHKWGGYSEWFLPQRFKVFIDGRQMVYGTDLFADYYRILENMPEADDLLRDWKPDAFLLEYGSKLGARFARTREMALVHWDDSSLLYLARNNRNAALINRHEYRRFNPEAGFSGKPAGIELDPPADERSRSRLFEADPPADGRSRSRLFEADPPAQERSRSRLFEADIRRAIKENPGNGRPWNSLAALFLSRGMAQEAREASAEAIKLAPNAVSALLTAADSAMALQDWGDARKLISRAQSADSSACAPRLSMAKLASLQGDTKRALALADTAITTGLKRRRLWKKPEPALVDSYLFRSGLLEKAGDQARSVDALRRAGNMAYELGDPAMALSIYRHGLKVAPTDARFYHNIGVVLSTGEKNAEAILYLRKALQLDVKNSDTMTALGVAYYRIKLLPLAREMWEKAVATTPKHPEATQYLKQTAEKPD